ncbi:hypothetical protein BJ912DRAFT_848467 [Pholiota molesta]|nr:hypothetical protein BJ912DRAFT_848467 [Pholiota molesta]
MKVLAANGASEAKKRTREAEDYYSRLTETGKERFEGKLNYLGRDRALICTPERTRAAIKAFISKEDKTGANITPSMRRTIREVQDFVPEAGVTSRELALLVHRNSLDNLQCRFHEKSKDKEHYDGNMIKGQRIHGVAFQMKLAGSTARPVKAEPGFMNCGCHIDDVLLDFFWWKTWIIRSRNPNLFDATESMMESVFPPRPRAFFVHAFLNISHLKLDDFYGLDYGTLAYYVRILTKQVTGIFGRLRAFGVPDKLIRELAKPPTKVPTPGVEMDTESSDDDEDD